MLTEDQLVAAVPGLHRYALALTRSGDAADELVQDTIVKALAKADTFRGESSPATWLHRILYRAFVDDQRRRHSLPTPDEILMPAVDRWWADADYTVSPERVVDRASDRASLLDALVRLPYDLRSAVILHDAEGRTAAEIAAIHEISLAAAKQRIRRGRAALVSALDAEDDRRKATKGVPMTCVDARALVSDYLDGELDDPRRTLVERHLATCPTCPGLYAALVGVQVALTRLRDPDTVVPPDLVIRARERLNER